VRKSKQMRPSDGLVAFAFILAIAVAAWGAWGYVYVPWYMGLQHDALEAGAKFGDLFGGINALFTALAFAAVAWSGWMQRNELALQREELELQRKEVADILPMPFSRTMRSFQNSSIT
jgi:hypothetical protein